MPLDLYLILNLRNKKHNKIRSFLLYNIEKLKELKINIEIQYIDIDNIDFSTYEKIKNIPSLYNKNEEFTLTEYNKIINYLSNLI